ncbi:hypothetical protein RSOLAG22IIIB_09193 [Rhizoctonia solani]|uniref:Uncharacterized protein n=1 Tax=Rhizoctonia solani TaxID=456999 RepID=A0A0K6FXR6_9AGAM|nr:hypothetical protein RSOLAG22IIIB_09193 [Rhizoctonia solani]
MARRRSNAPGSNTTFSFPIQLPVLHPPRLKRKTSSSNTNASAPVEPAPTQNHKRSNTLELPEVENDDDTVPQIHFKRTHMTSVVSRSLNVQLTQCGKPGKLHGQLESNKKLLVYGDDHCTQEHNSIEPPNLALIFSSPRTAALELSLDEPPMAFTPLIEQTTHFSDHTEIYTEPLEELVVRAARSRAQHHERIARKWENMCNARIRFLREQAIHHRMLAQMSAAAAHFGAFPVPSSRVPSPSESFGAPLSRMSSRSPYATYGETIDLATMASVQNRQQILSDLGSCDSRSLVECILECMYEFEYDEVCVDGLSEAECRQLRAECRKRRRLDRQRAWELGVLLELKHRQLGRSRSPSASSDSSDSSLEPSTPPPTPLAVRSVDQLVAKMLMKRREAGHRPCTSGIATRAAFQARGCSSLRQPIEPECGFASRPRGRSESTKAAFSDLFSFSGGMFGLGNTAWLKEKKRLTALDIE